jgi:DNA topoisomerase I
MGRPPAGYLPAMRLRRWDWSGPALARRVRGRGFSYLDEDGRTISDPEVLERIRGLVIPPAWRDVRICPWPHGHLQAVGIDDAGRRQYLYHEQWRQHRDDEKFRHVRTFAHALPRGRATFEEHLTLRGLCRERVLAAAAILLDTGAFRIGGEEYVETNGSHGLATLTREQVAVRRGPAIEFDYPAKSGRQQMLLVARPDVASVVRSLLRRPDDDESLLACFQSRAWRPIRSTDINEYLGEVLGAGATAKDFRTWHGTVLAAVALADAGPVKSRSARRQAEAAAMREVAEHLGNTPAVSRSAYVDPVVVEAYREGVTIDPAIATRGPLSEPKVRDAAERAVLDLLDQDEVS